MSALNDPRVLFAAERTALAWNRTALALMAFGFAVERFGLFMHMLEEKKENVSHAGPSFWLGISFILLGGFYSTMAAKQYKDLFKALQPEEIPSRYNHYLAFSLNIFVSLLAAALISYLVILNLIIPNL